jgi:hypothetical protein
MVGHNIVREMSQSSNDDKSSREKVLQQKAFEFFVERALVRT